MGDLARPYDGGTILEAMRTSRRPGGVPDHLETGAIADAIAASIQTIGGTPWVTLTVGASCGSQRCTIEVAGAPPESVGEDLYVFAIDSASGAVELVDATLAGLNSVLVAQLDDLARTAAPRDLRGFVLTTARRDIQAPDRFVLSYRSGGEEGSPGLNVVVDATSGDVRTADD